MLSSMRQNVILSHWNPGSLAPDPPGSYASTLTIQGSPWIIEGPHGTQALGSLILSRAALVCSLYLYSIVFTSLPSMWLHGGGGAWRAITPAA